MIDNLRINGAFIPIVGVNQTPQGKGLRKRPVVLCDSSDKTRTATTTAFGYYRFTNVAASETYIFQVSDKRFPFAPQVLNITERLII